MAEDKSVARHSRKQAICLKAQRRHSRFYERCAHWSFNRSAEIEPIHWHRERLVLAGTALWAMGLASRSSHWAHLVLGVLLLAAPWLLAYPSGVTAADVVTLAAGAVAVAAGLLGLRRQRVGEVVTA